MNLVSRKPQPPLSVFVRTLWCADGYLAGPHARERILPTGQPSLIIDLCEKGTAMISGPHSRSFLLETAAQLSVIGIEFESCGAFAILGAPLNQVANSHVPLDAVWGADAAELRERVLEGRTPAAKLRVLERWLLRRLATAPTGHPAVAYAMQAFSRNPGVVRIAEVAADTGLSHRRFLDHFTSEVGLTPKVFCRVQRFQQALHHVRASHDVDWADVALSCGYYDQAHLINEFQTLSGLTPAAYRAAAGPHRNHVPISG